MLPFRPVPLSSNARTPYRFLSDMRLPESPYNVLLPVALPSSGPELLRLATSLAPGEVDVNYYALHLNDGGDADTVSPAETTVLAPLLARADELGVHVHTVTGTTDSVGEGIARIAAELDAQLVLMGWYGTVTRGSEEDTVAHRVMRETRADVGLYLARQFRPWKSVIVPVYGGPHDLAALSLARTLVTRSEIDITIFHVVPPDRASNARLGVEETRVALGYRTEHVKIVESDDPHGAVVDEVRSGYDLVILGASQTSGLEANVFGTQHERLARECPASLLIVCGAAPKSLGPVEDQAVGVSSAVR